MALHPQQQKVASADAQGQNARPVQIHPSYLEQWLLTKWTGGKEQLWQISQRSLETVDRNDIQAVLRKQKAKAGTGEQQLNIPEMKGMKRKQAIRLVNDRNAGEPHPHFEWILRNIRLDMEAKRKTKAMHIILERRPCEIPRAVRQPLQPCHSSDVVDVGPDPNAGRIVRGQVHGKMPPSTGVPESQQSNGLNQNTSGHPDQGNRQLSQAWAEIAVNPATRAKLYEAQQMQAARAKMYEAQQRQAAASQTQYPQQSTVMNGGQYFREKEPAKGKKPAPKIMAVESDEEDSASASDSNRTSDESDCATEITAPSSASRCSTDYGRGSNETMKERGKPSPRRQSRERSRRKSVTVRQHKRPGRRGASPSESDSDAFSDHGENKKRGRQQPERPRHKSPHHSRKQHVSPDIRQHDRPRGRDVSPSDHSGRYVDELHEIKPHRRVGTRRVSIHGGISGYRPERPSLGHRRLASHDSQYSFGLPERARTAIVSLNPGDRTRRHWSQYGAADDVSYLEFQQDQLLKAYDDIEQEKAWAQMCPLRIVS